MPLPSVEMTDVTFFHRETTSNFVIYHCQHDLSTSEKARNTVELQYTNFPEMQELSETVAR